MIEKTSEKLKGMTVREKIDFIWEYYKIPIVSTVLILLFIGSMINSIYINPPKKQFAHLTVYGPYLEPLLLDKVGQSIADQIVDDPESQTVYTANIFNNPNDIEANLAIFQKFFAMIAVQELDVIIASYDDMYQLAYDGTLLDLTDILNNYGLNIDRQDLLELTALETTQESPYAIMLHGSDVMADNNLNVEGYYIGIIINSPRITESVSMLKCIMNINK